MAVKELQRFNLCWQILENVEPVKRENELIEEFENEFGKIPFANQNRGKTLKVVELFAGVGGFRIGLEKASSKYKTVLANQWEPSTKIQHAANVYRKQFGNDVLVNEDINVLLEENYSFPDHDLLVGGFPCQDFSVANSLSRSKGLDGEGKLMV